MKIAVTGAAGMLGSALVRRLPRVIPGAQIIPFTRPDFDITDERAVHQAIHDSRPDALVNSAAYTGVDQAEKERDDSYKVNAIAPGYIAGACASIGARLIHISTDYVFDGSKSEPYTEEDEPSPIGAYARSKAAGEKEALEKCPDTLLVRTAWLYGHDGANFVTTILEKGLKLGKLQVVNDQFGSPTYADDLAMAIGELIEKETNGIVHAANSGYCTWHELAVEALSRAGLHHVEVDRVDSEAYPALAHRPKNSRLDTSRLESIIGKPLRNWRAALAEFIDKEKESIAKAGEA